MIYVNIEIKDIVQRNDIYTSSKILRNETSIIITISF